MACQPEIWALECELSDGDGFDPAPALTSRPKPRRARRKILWKKVIEFDTEAEAKVYVGDNWKHLRTNRTKLDDRRSEVFYCQRHGKSCPPQAKYEHTPGEISLCLNPKIHTTRAWELECLV